MTDPVFIPVESGNAAHNWGLRLFGGIGEADHPRLESAIESVKLRFQYAGGDLFDVAGGYAQNIGGGHVFTHGNKAAGALVALTFLELNGVTTGTVSGALLHQVISGIASGRSAEELGKVLREGISGQRYS